MTARAYQALGAAYEKDARDLRARAEIILLFGPDRSKVRRPTKGPDLTGWGPNAWEVSLRYLFEGNPRGFLVNYTTRFLHF